jgi:hypothetical protein
MYGMVNKAVEELVCQQFGEEAWETIKAKAGVEVDVFISNKGYPDEMTYQLVAAASEVLNLPAQSILHAFGEYWVLHTARKGYGDLMAAGGRTLPEFLINLPNFHSRVALMFPDLAPPRFEYSDHGPDRITVHYYSHRPGLAAFVVGLLHGLAKMYETPAEVTQLTHRDQGADHDTFLVRWSPPGAP